MRIAHYSDIHVTIPPPSGGVRGLFGKRVMGAANYYFGGRRRHFANVETRIRVLLEDIDAQNVDHALCTGDITQMSWPEEFERCAALYGDRLSRPEHHTVLPGNHDRYTIAADRERRFERYFGTVSSPDGTYPFVKALPGGVTIVGVDVARAAGLLDSSGRAGPEQLSRLEKILTDPAHRDTFVVLAMHYGLLRSRGQPDRLSHGIRDFQEIVALLERNDTTVDVVVHGHMHGAYRIEVGGVQEICAGSATDLHRMCGYNIYEIDVSARSLSVTRRVWDDEGKVYKPQASGPRI